MFLDSVIYASTDSSRPNKSQQSEQDGKELNISLTLHRCNLAYSLCPRFVFGPDTVDPLTLFTVLAVILMKILDLFVTG